MEQENIVEPVVAQSAATEESESVAKLSEYKLFAVLGYLVPPLFFLPLLNEKMKHIPAVRFHANQQLVLLLLLLGAYVGSSILYAIVFVSFIGFIADIVYVGTLVLSFYGAYNAYNDEMKELPFIGTFQVLK